MAPVTESLPPLICALLADPACYDHPAEKITLVETHISWVLLTGRYAYKIKKPVNPGFLDFSTLALRHQDCLEELRLNKRLAADIYLAVVAITGSVDAPRINDSPLPNPPPFRGEGANESLREIDEILEYAVKMRQFLSDATLDKLAERGELGNGQIDALAARLAQFHLFECERAAADTPWGEPELIAHPVEENFELLQTRLEDSQGIRALAALQRWCRDEHARLSPLMRERKQHGWVRECHGDLHLANLAWADGRLVIFDCLEFSPALRWIDVISEVAFCYMDLLQRNLAALAARFLNTWLAITGDYQGVALLRYYAVYRALVRAKVAALRAEQGCLLSRAEMNECLQLAEQLALTTPHSLLSRNNLGCSPLVVRGMPLRHPPSLFITHGLSGSGKTTLSQLWLEKYGLIRLRSDVERKRLAGLDALARCGADQGLYSQLASRRTYEHLLHLTDGLLQAGWSVVVDAAFLERGQRDLFRNLAQRLDVDFKILDIQADADVLRERIRRRQAGGRDASEADLCVLAQQLAAFVPLDEAEREAVVCFTAEDDKL